MRDITTAFAVCNWGSADRKASDGGTFDDDDDDNNNNNISLVTDLSSPVLLLNQR